MTLVDSSCWIEFYRPAGDQAIQAAVAEAIETDQAATCAMVRLELLAYITRKKEYELVAEDLGALPTIPLLEETFDKAIQLGRTLRAKGATAPATDLLIAAAAMDAGALLLHADRHFELIAEHTGLRTHYLGR